MKGSITSRPELHGDDTIPALTISVGGIVLFSKDIILMYNDEDAHNRLFTSKRGAGLEPAFLGTLLWLSEIFKGAKVSIGVPELDLKLVLKPATVKDIWLEPQDAGGHVVMSCKILGAPPEDASVNPLKMVNKKCTIAIQGGTLAAREAVDENQNELPLDEGGPGSDEEKTQGEREEEEATARATGDEPEVGNIGRQIGRSEARTKRAAKKKGLH